MTHSVGLEMRGGVCVIRCDGPQGCDVAKELDLALAHCRDGRGRDIVIDIDRVDLSAEALEAFRAAVDVVHADGGELVFAVEDPETRAGLAKAGLVRARPATPSPAVLTPETVAALPERARWEHQFVFPAVVSELPAARRRVAAYAEVAGLRGPDLFELTVAVSEALTNAVVHGSPDGVDDDVRVHFFCYEDEVAVEVVDCGSGIEASPVCVPVNTAVSGRGIHFMRSLTDTVQFQCGPRGTHALLIKHRASL